MAIDWTKVDDMTLALLHLTTFKERFGHRAWKGHDWEVLGRLHASGWISDPATKAKSVVLSEEGEQRSRELFEKYFGVADERPAKRSGR
ncbi:MAG: DUF6429 family protein [Anaeromyxobacteraceae bacterium]